jgi:RNA polymerase sigma factor for flagellar operon FliA
MQRGVNLLLQPERVEAALWRAHTERPDAETRMRLFEHYRPFAARLARSQFLRRKEGNFEREDIEQLAYEALLHAIELFEAKLGVPFEAYARIRINGHIANGLAQVSEVAAQFRHRQRTERERLKSLRPPADSSVDPLSALSALSATIALGLMLNMEAAADIEAIPDPAPSAYETLAWNELHAKVHELVDNLPEREGFVIHQHYRNGVSFQQIALLTGVTKGRVSQIHRSGLERLRGLLAKLR